MGGAAFLTDSHTQSNPTVCPTSCMPPPPRATPAPARSSPSLTAGPSSSYTSHGQKTEAPSTIGPDTVRDPADRDSVDSPNQRPLTAAPASASPSIREQTACHRVAQCGTQKGCPDSEQIVQKAGWIFLQRHLDHARANTLTCYRPQLPLQSERPHPLMAPRQHRQTRSTGKQPNGITGEVSDADESGRRNDELAQSTADGPPDQVRSDVAQTDSLGPAASGSPAFRALTAATAQPAEQRSLGCPARPESPCKQRPACA